LRSPNRRIALTKASELPCYNGHLQSDGIVCPDSVAWLAGLKLKFQFAQAMQAARNMVLNILPLLGRHREVGKLNAVVV
jgi:hypothetical protein